MLIPRERAQYRFSAAFDLDQKSEREFLHWVFNQFLYGEVTGIQCGYWLYHAPHLNAASFLARQATEELSHVKRILKILEILGGSPGEAHPAIRFLATGMMGGSWGEHVAMEMALGEGLVLQVFYAMEETIPNPEIKKLITSAIVDEEKHVRFGEAETLAWLKKHPHERVRLLSQAWLQYWAMKFLSRYLSKKWIRESKWERHPVLSQFPAFFERVIDVFDERLIRLGVSSKPIRQYGFGAQATFMWTWLIGRVSSVLPKRKRLLTDTYLQDAWISETPTPTSEEMSHRDHP